MWYTKKEFYIVQILNKVDLEWVTSVIWWDRIKLNWIDDVISILEWYEEEQLYSILKKLWQSI